MKGTTSQFLHCATLLPVPVLGGDGAGCADIVMIIHQNRSRNQQNVHFDLFNSDDFCLLYILFSVILFKTSSAMKRDCKCITCLGIMDIGDDVIHVQSLHRVIVAPPAPA